MRRGYQAAPFARAALFRVWSMGLRITSPGERLTSQNVGLTPDLWDQNPAPSRIWEAQGRIWPFRV